MQLVEQHRKDRHDLRWAAIDVAAFASKNLYNAALYLTRQAYIKDHTVISYNALDTLMQPAEQYHVLPAQVAQWVLKQVCLAWTSYFAAGRAWEEHPETFLGHPKLPQYLPKQGRNLLTYTTQAISRNPKNAGWIVPSGLRVRVATKHPFETIDQVRIVPHATHYTVEVICEQPLTPADVDPQWVAGLDLGVNNLAAVTSNQPGFVPLLVNGRPLKALNQLYNKQRAHCQPLLSEGQYTSRRLDHLTDKRKRRVDSYSSCRQPADRGPSGPLSHRPLGDREERWLEAKGGHGAAKQPDVRFLASCPVHPDADLQGAAGGNSGHPHRRVLHEQVQLPG